jgi:hypothetical protein
MGDDSAVELKPCRGQVVVMYSLPGGAKGAPIEWESVVVDVWDFLIFRAALENAIEQESAVAMFQKATTPGFAFASPNDRRRNNMAFCGVDEVLPVFEGALAALRLTRRPASELAIPVLKTCIESALIAVLLRQKAAVHGSLAETGAHVDETRTPTQADVIEDIAGPIVALLKRAIAMNRGVYLDAQAVREATAKQARHPLILPIQARADVEGPGAL